MAPLNRTTVGRVFFSGIRRITRMRLRHVAVDCFLAICCSVLVLYLRAPDRFSTYWNEFAPLIPIILVIQTVIFLSVGVYDMIWRYFSAKDALKLSKSIVLTSILNVTAAYFLFSRIPRGTFILTAALRIIALVGVRFLRRYLHEYPSAARVTREGRATIIYGAGTNGRTLVSRLQTDYDAGYQLVGFVDDDREKWGRVISGITVMGGGADLARILESTGARELIVAVAKPSGDLLSEVMRTASRFGICPRLIKQVASRYQDGRKVEVLREIELNDLLSRRKLEIDLSSLESLIPDKRVLVTGAGGSIGSELAKQIHRLGPKELLLLDHSEYHLYEIDQALRGTASSSNVVPILADIKCRRTLEKVFRDHEPQIVFHAAAYKHVHLVEANPYAAIMNNVLGTRHLLELSEGKMVESFVLISSDKAVNPGGVMGSTKRLCELMVTDAGLRTGRRFASVRFGNVLGSSGSLIPKLKDQIRQGKAVTITHRDMKRYFMLIPEAVSLVLKAASLARSGDIMVLSMGEPLRIVDLARSLITLMGRTEADVPIVYTGVRPGEKLQEELYLTGAEQATYDPDILVIPKGDDPLCARLRSESLGDEISAILLDAQSSNPEAVARMQRLIRGEMLAEPRPRKIRPQIETQDTVLPTWNPSEITLM